MDNEELILKELLQIKNDVGEIKGSLKWFNWKTVTPAIIFIAAAVPYII